MPGILNSRAISRGAPLIYFLQQHESKAGRTCLEAEQTSPRLHIKLSCCEVCSELVWSGVVCLLWFMDGLCYHTAYACLHMWLTAGCANTDRYRPSMFFRQSAVGAGAAAAGFAAGYAMLSTPQCNAINTTSGRLESLSKRLVAVEARLTAAQEPKAIPMLHHLHSAKSASVKNMMDGLQGHFVGQLEKLAVSGGADAQSHASFREVSWLRDGGLHGGGVRFTAAAQNSVFNNASVNVSAVHYEDKPGNFPIDSATAFSVILHPNNPFAPSMHFHIRCTVLLHASTLSPACLAHVPPLRLPRGLLLPPASTPSHPLAPARCPTPSPPHTHTLL